LFRAGIAPRRAAGRITKAQAQKLSRAIKAVLTAAIKIGGTTLRDYVNADGEAGYFRQRLFVYERAGARCRVCKATVKQFTQGQRSTYWCATCQR
jgi:formamidopyrimidine-DNA glycosylase